MRYVHVAQMDPERHEGGVAQFARDLRSAIPELVFYANPSDYRGVERLNCDDLRTGIITSDDVVIADGYYGVGLGGNVKRLVTVCHGTYAGWLRGWGINPSPKFERIRGWLLGAAKAQERAFKESDDVVAVSESAALELWEIYRIDAAVIINGVDVDKYQPCPSQSARVVEVAGDDERKGSDMVAELREVGWDIERLGYEGEKWERWQGFEVAFLPSRAEGGQYAALEAMATNKKIVAFRSGLFRVDVPERYFFGTSDYHRGTFDALLHAALECEAELNPREWVLEHATLEGFRKQWVKLLKGEG